jgi:hypothetical protein
MQILRTKSNKAQANPLLRKILSRKGILLAVVLCICGSIFVSGVIYGGYLHKTTQSAMLKKMASGIFKQKFDLVANYLDGLQADPVVIFIDMKNNDYQKLAYLRDKTLTGASGRMSEEVKAEVVRGKISVKGLEQKFPAEFSLSGMNLDHIGQPQKWSLRVKIKKKKLLLGMNNFTLIVPRARSSEPFTEWLNHKLEQYIGLISLRYDYVKVILNGKDLGIYALEERFDKRLLERNERREGIIIKFADSERQTFKVYGQKKLAKNPALAEQAKHLETVIAGFWAGDIPASAIFDTDKLARYYAMTDLVNGHHTHFLGNEFFYLSPITRLLEPIGREWSSPFKRTDTYRLFVEDFSVGPFSYENIQLFNRNLFRDAEFTQKYFEHLQSYASESFLDAFLAAESDAVANARQNLYSEGIYNDTSPAYLYSKIEYITTFINSDFSTGIRAYRGANIGQMQVTLNNQHNFPVRCTSLRTSENNYSINELIQSNGETQVTLPVKLSPEDAHSAYLDCRVPGIQNPFTVKVSPWERAEATAKNIYPVSNYADNPSIKSDGTKLTINAGALTLSENLVITKDQSLTIKAGADIDLLNGAFILSYGTLTIDGTQSAPVRITSSDGTGRGIVVLNAPDQNEVMHAIFSKLKPAVFPGWSVSAAVLFHETDVVIDHVLFDSNDSEDALNIVRSSFAIRNSTFDGNKSDAFDSDFSTGTIENTRFLATGNDSIDTSGSNINISNIFISGSGDKGISVGEASVMTGNNVTVKESGIAISSKDNSSFEFENLSINDNALGFALFQKKPEYGPTQGVIRNMTMSGEGKDYLVETGSSLSIDNNLMVGEIDDVKALMYGNVYGRKTLR